MKSLFIFSLSFALALITAGFILASENKTKPQDLCPVMGHKIDSKVFTDYQGRRIYFCCTECIKKFKAEPAAYLNKLEIQSASPAGAAKKQTDCPVMGMKITPGIYIDYKGKRVSFCCPSCLEKFNADPDGLVKKMEAEGVVFEKTPDLRSGNPGETEKETGHHQH